MSQAKAAQRALINEQVERFLLAGGKVKKLGNYSDKPQRHDVKTDWKTLEAARFEQRQIGRKCCQKNTAVKC